MTTNQVVNGGPPAGGVGKAGKREWIALGVLLLPLLLVSMDTSVLLFAVPFITKALHPSSTQQLWMYDIYGFVLAGLLITMGAVGDRIGRRRLLLAGAFFFSVASLGAAYAANAGELIGARAVQGIAGATLMPSTLALIRNMFHDEAQRKKAIGVWTGGMMSGVMLGPVLSGVLLNHFWWGSIFLINIPFMVMLLILAPLLLPEYRSPQTGRFDLPGALLSFGGVLPIIFGVTEISENGVDDLRVASIAVGAVLGVLFLIRQAKAKNPMIELRLFRSRGYSGALATCLLAMFAVLGNAIFLTQYLQSVLNMSPFTAALWSLVPSAGVGAVIGVTGALAKKFDRAYVIAGSFATVLGGYAVQATLLHANSHLWVLLIGAALVACGAIGVMTLGNELMLGQIPPDRAGAAAAMNETVSELGGALGMAVMGSIGAAAYRHHMAAGAPAAAKATLGGAVAVATGHAQSPSAATQLLSEARNAFTEGFGTASYVGVGVMAVALLGTLFFLRGIKLPGTGEGEARVADGAREGGARTADSTEDVRISDSGAVRGLNGTEGARIPDGETVRISDGLASQSETQSGPGRLAYPADTVQAAQN